MKPMKYIVLAWLTLGMGGAPAVCAGEEDLPPGVQMYRGGDAIVNENEDAYIIYTRDDPEKVTDFYRKTLGMEPSRERDFYLGNWYLGELAGEVHVRIHAASDREHPSISEDDLFGLLRDELYMAWTMGNHQHGRKDFRALKRKYAHLTRGWYPKLDVKEKLHACRKYAAANKNAYMRKSEANSARMQELMAQGRYEELRALAGKQVQTGAAYQDKSTTVHWDEWVGCYRDLDQHDYQVQIVIDKVDDDVEFRPVAGGHGRPARKAGKDGANELMKKGLEGVKGLFGF